MNDDCRVTTLLPAARKLFLSLKYYWLPESPYLARSWAIYIQAEVEVETKLELKFSEAQEDEPAFFDMFSMDLSSVHFYIWPFGTL